MPLLERLTSVKQAEWAQEAGGELGAPGVGRKGRIGTVLDGHRGRAVSRGDSVAANYGGRRVLPVITTARGRPEELDQRAEIATSPFRVRSPSSTAVS